MNTDNIILNDVFSQNAKEYVTRPVLAAKYQPGMENGWMVRYSNIGMDGRSNKLFEGARFFSTVNEAWGFINAKEQQCVKEDGKIVGMEVRYESPHPVLYIEETGTRDNGGTVMQSDVDTFLSDESDKYEYFILGDDCWIVQDMDGVIRVWDRSMDVPFFGNVLEIVYEENGDGGYIRVAV